MDVDTSFLSLWPQVLPDIFHLGNSFELPEQNYVAVQPLSHFKPDDGTESVARLYVSDASLDNITTDYWAGNELNDRWNRAEIDQAETQLGINTYQRFEAEDALLRGGTYVSHETAYDYSGQGFVKGFTKTGASVSFTINIAEAGDYHVTLRYLDDRLSDNFQPLDAAKFPLSLYVNGQAIDRAHLPPTEQSLEEKRSSLLVSLSLLFEQAHVEDKNIVIPPADRLDLFFIHLRSFLNTLLIEPLSSRQTGWQSKTELVSLNVGTNMITYQIDEDDNGGVALDYIWFSKAAENGPIGTPILKSDLAVEVQKFVRIPDASNGRPRLNSFAYTGDRLFVSEETDGHIYEVIDGQQEGKTTRLFLDLKSAVRFNTGRNLNTDTAWHSGLRGITFHPQFATNGKFYTSFMEDRPSNPANHVYISDSSQPINADSVLVEWTYNHQDNRVDIDSYREVFRIGMPVYDHPIRQITFNPFAQPGGQDYGLLYVAHGDGSVQSATAGGGMRADGLGKILRINPLQHDSYTYTIPPNNPFVNDPGMLDEVFSLGHRNPHTLAFVQNPEGDSHLIVGEVGRDNIEEINLIFPGENYGWPEREGTFVHLPTGGGIIQGVAPLPEDDAKYGYRYPVIQWGHNGQPGQGFVGQAVAGGYVVSNDSALDGQFIFADFAASGRIFHAAFSDMLAATTKLDLNNPNQSLTQSPMWEASILFDHDDNASTPALLKKTMKDVINDEPTYDRSDRADLRFGQGPEGELYILNKRNGYIYLVTNSL